MADIPVLLTAQPGWVGLRPLADSGAFGLAMPRATFADQLLGRNGELVETLQRALLC